MKHDIVCQQESGLPMPTSEHLLTTVLHSSQAVLAQQPGRGRPATLSNLHLCLGIVLCGLRGFGAQLALWRLLCMEPIGPLAPVQIVDQAVYNRLERAAGLMQALFGYVSRWMREQLDGLQDRRLAPFASQVLALDESTLDAVARWLPELRCATS